MVFALYLYSMKLATKLIHAGIEPDPSTGAIMTPIYQTSTYVQSAPGQHKGYEYARSQNPTRKVLETALAHIENGKYGLCFSSGVAATDAVLRLLQPGDEVIAANDMYGGTYRLFTKIFEKSGIRFHFINMQDPANITAYINANTRLIWAETPTNPLMNIVDISAGGIGFIVHTPAIPLETGTLLLGCRIEAPDGAVVEVDLEVRYTRPMDAPEGKSAVRSGCRLVNPSAEALALIRLYVGSES